MADSQPSGGEKYTETRGQVKEWIIAEHCKFNPTPSGRLVWCLRVEQGAQTKFAVLQKQGRPDILYFEIPINFYEFEESVRNLSANDQQELLHELRFALLNHDVNFVLDDLSLGSVVIRQHLYTEELTRANFWRVVLELQRAVTAFSWTLLRRFPTIEAQASVIFDAGDSVN